MKRAICAFGALAATVTLAASTAHADVRGIAAQPQAAASGVDPLPPPVRKSAQAIPPASSPWLYFASAVLPAGRVVIEGGEYNHGTLTWTNQGAIYNPLTNKWTTIKPPTGTGWSRIGDAPSTVLANGQFMLGASGYSGTKSHAILNAGTLTWTATGAGKADGNGEEGWSLLPGHRRQAVRHRRRSRRHPSRRGRAPRCQSGRLHPTGAFLPIQRQHPDPRDGRPNAASQASNYGYMLVLPTGQVLFNDRIGQMVLFNSSGAPKTSWRPTVTSVPRTLTPGDTYTLSGRQLNGLTQAAAYGDDYQDATNYPLVRVTNTATGDVAYARSSGMTSMSVTPGAASSTQFTLPATIGTGASTLKVVANGIASAPVDVTVS